jgi:hypothetical protein
MYPRIRIERLDIACGSINLTPLPTDDDELIAREMLSVPSQFTGFGESLGKPIGNLIRVTANRPVGTVHQHRCKKCEKQKDQR